MELRSYSVLCGTSCQLTTQAISASKSGAVSNEHRRRSCFNEWASSYRWQHLWGTALGGRAEGGFNISITERWLMEVYVCNFAVDCEPTWITRKNVHSQGATLIIEPISADDCLNRCAVDGSCVAVDLVTSCTPPQCWTHHNRNNLRRRYYGVNITQYEVLTRCATMAPPVSGNRLTNKAYIQWQPQIMMATNHVIGGHKVDSEGQSNDVLWPSFLWPSLTVMWP